jgi:hypothetical protein
LKEITFLKRIKCIAAQPRGPSGYQSKFSHRKTYISDSLEFKIYRGDESLQNSKLLIYLRFEIFVGLFKNRLTQEK